MLRLATCIVVLFALTGCSKQPLRDKSISEVKEMVKKWNFGEISEQQWKGLAIANTERDRIEAQRKNEIYAAEQKAEKSKEEIGAELEAAILKNKEVFASMESWPVVWSREEKKRSEMRDKRLADEAAIAAIYQSELKSAKEAVGQKKDKAIANAIAKYEKAMKNARVAHNVAMQERKAQFKAEQKRDDTKKNKASAELKFAKEKAEKTKAKMNAEKNNEILVAEEKAKKAEAIVDAKAKAELEAELGVKSIHAQSLFYDVFGEPEKRQLVGDNYYFYYNCKEGMVQLDINGYLLDNEDVVLIKSVNVY